MGWLKLTKSETEKGYQADGDRKLAVKKDRSTHSEPTLIEGRNVVKLIVAWVGG